MDGAVEVLAQDGVGLEVVGLSADDLDESLVLGADLDARLVEVDELLPALEVLAELAAAVKAAVGAEQAGDKRGVGAGPAEADVGVLADGDVRVSDPGVAARGLGHVRHDADGARKALVDGASDAEVDGV